jgi:hypothetical protein
MARGQYFTEYGGARRDLFDVFQVGYVAGQGITGFWDQDGIDLAGYFQPLSNGSSCGFNTGFVASDGRDIAEWFAAAGTVAPSGNWPVGGGFVIAVGGQERFVTDTVTALSGRMTWQYQNLNGSPSDTAYGQNLIADRNNLCPGVATPNATAWADEGGFVRNSIYGLPATAVLRFEVYTDNLPGSAYWDITVGGQTEWAPGWNTVHSGGIPLCSNTPPYIEDPMNVFDVSPAPGTYYGQMAPYVYWSSPNYWAVRLAAMFTCNKGDGHLNIIRVRVRRLS